MTMRKSTGQIQEHQDNPGLYAEPVLEVCPDVGQCHIFVELLAGIKCSKSARGLSESNFEGPKLWVKGSGKEFV